MQNEKKIRFFTIWIWTLELYVSFVVLVLWLSLVFDFEWAWIVRGWVHTEFDATWFPIILLLICSALCWRQKKGHAVFGVLLCLLWGIWMELPRL